MQHKIYEGSSSHAFAAISSARAEDEPRRSGRDSERGSRAARSETLEDLATPGIGVDVRLGYPINPHWEINGG
jgi:hypothetical protein